MHFRNTVLSVHRDKQEVGRLVGTPPQSRGPGGLTGAMGWVEREKHRIENTQDSDFQHWVHFRVTLKSFANTPSA